MQKKLKLNRVHYPKEWIFTSWDKGDFKNSKKIFTFRNNEWINPFTKEQIDLKEVTQKEFIKAEGWITINSGEWLNRKIRQTVFAPKIEDNVKRFEKLYEMTQNPKGEEFIISNNKGEYDISYVPDYKKTQYFENGQDIPKIDDEKMSWFLEKFPKKYEEILEIITRINNSIADSGYAREDVWPLIKEINKITTRNVYEKVSGEELVEKSGIMFLMEDADENRLNKLEQGLLLQLDEIRIARENLRISNSNKEEEFVKIPEENLEQEDMGWLTELE